MASPVHPSLGGFSCSFHQFLRKNLEICWRIADLRVTDQHRQERETTLKSEREGWLRIWPGTGVGAGQFEVISTERRVTTCENIAIQSFSAASTRHHTTRSLRQKSNDSLLRHRLCNWLFPQIVDDRMDDRDTVPIEEKSHVHHPDNEEVRICPRTEE